MGFAPKWEPESRDGRLQWLVVDLYVIYSYGPSGISPPSGGPNSDTILALWEAGWSLGNFASKWGPEFRYHILLGCCGIAGGIRRANFLISVRNSQVRISTPPGGRRFAVQGTVESDGTNCLQFGVVSGPPVKEL